MCHGNQGRTFQCATCGREVSICRECDRENRYCSKGCSDQGRRASVKAAKRRYQREWRGRVKHAEDQHNYVLRLRSKKVRDHPSPNEPSFETVEEAPPEEDAVEDKTDHGPDAEAPAKEGAFESAQSAPAPYKWPGKSSLWLGFAICDFCGRPIIDEVSSTTPGRRWSG